MRIAIALYALTVLAAITLYFTVDGPIGLLLLLGGVSWLGGVLFNKIVEPWLREKLANG